MDSEKTQKAANLMRKELEDIVKNKEEVIFYSANLLNQLRRIRNQLRNTKHELMSVQNKQAASCVCFNHKVAPDRVSICLQEVKHKSAASKGLKNTVALPTRARASEKAVPNFRRVGISKTSEPSVTSEKEKEDSPSSSSSDSIKDEDSTSDDETMKLLKPKKSRGKAKRTKTSKDKGDNEARKPLRKPKKKPVKRVVESSSSDEDEIHDTFLTSEFD